ncbi:nitrate- and nitrite sensing domain-containing protein [Actinospica durhamensis]|uniref:histidine kinase n=1 Tax=Actinospica durhamensis TaxID=1508375 RepID=A0A941EZ83_9ACTN|nr:nitrate- and nitrite sensing domain-containing protein [Actinospica durhamensis]MBR7837879.1 nitrate- and nitrite sensing domain-containing protein [Actinospica durhamensis]
MSIRDRRRPARRAAHARPADNSAGTGAGRPRPRNSRLLRLAPRTVRARIVCLLALPVVSLTSLWGIAAVNTISAAFTQSQLHALDESVTMPLDQAVLALDQERSAADAYLAAGGTDPGTLNQRIAATRAAAGRFTAGAEQSAAAAADVSGELTARLNAVTKAFDALTPVRTAVVERATSAAAADQTYASAVDAAFAVQSALAAAPGAPVTAQSALALAEAREQLSLQDSALAAGYAANTLGPAQYRQFTGAVYSERAYLAQAAIDLPDPTAGAAGATLTNIQNTVLSAGPGKNALGPGLQGVWAGAESSVSGALDQALRTAAAPATVNPYGRLLTTGSGFGVVLGLFALVFSLLISVGIGRRLVTDLVGLRDYALDLAGRRLPETMARLRAGQVVEPPQQAPPLDPEAGELGQVADALAVASHAAMRAAVERAELVSGVSGVFLNLARRSQVLVHRQLALLDAMERRIEEPDHLEDLFRLDHLATRMRRHAEGLIILSGATPGRAWRHPVQLTDVVRAAAAEAEDYPRVEVRRMPPARVVGPVVADLTHLLAELVENATSFSPPHTRVVIGGEPVGSGFAIEIEDRGLGMSPEALREANRRIGESSGDDLFDSDRLGLFVVSRLARRHEIRVSLCPSAYGGITAVVLIPSGVMQPPGGEERDGKGVRGARDARDEREGREGRDEQSEQATDTPAAPRPGPRKPSTAPDEETRRAFDDLDLDLELEFGLGRGRGPRPEPGTDRPERPEHPERREPTRRPKPPRPPETERTPTETQDPDPAAGPHDGVRVPHGNGHPVPAAEELSTSFDLLIPPPAVRAEDGATSKAPVGPDGLPHRVRQASLAPQLRREPEGPAPAQSPTAPRAPRSPEQNRAAMAAFQHGFTRGRADGPADPPPTAPTGSGTDAPAPAEAADHDERGDDTR